MKTEPEALQAIQGGASMFREEGFLFAYPTKESRDKSPGFGYASDMLALAVNRDDAKAFMFFLDQAGGVDCEVLIAGSIINYAAIHGAVSCVEAIHKAGGGQGKPLKHWLKIAEEPAYGPRAAKQFVA